MVRRSDDLFSRRDGLKIAGAGVLSAVVGRLGWAADSAQDPYAGFKMGMQSYSLRGYKLKEALAHTKMLGLKYWESFPGHVPLSTLPKTIAESKAALDETGITLMAYGVVDFDANETKSREKF